MNRMTTQMVVVASAIGLLVVGLGGGYWWARRAAGGAPFGMSTASGDASKDREVLYWYDPMVPDQQFKKPGKSPMGMQMVPRYAEPTGEQKVLYWYDPMVPDQHFEKAGKSPFMDMQLVPKYADTVGSTGVRIDPVVQQNVGIRTAVVELGSLDTRIRVPATLTWDLRRESVVSARVDGLISRLHVKAPYEPVRRGQPLATVLAPLWGSAIAEARALSQARSPAARSLQAAAQQRLHMLGLGGTSAGRNGGVVLRSPSDGVVSEVMVREGQMAMAGMPMFRVNDTRTLWLEAAIPQASTGGIGRGTSVEATVSAVPGRTFGGQVETLLPQIDTASRTQRARIVLRNDEGLLVPGMFAQLTLRPEAGASVPLVPAEALIATGTDSRVIVVAADGSFQPIRVQTGRRSDGRIEILSGLKGGERIVISGQFLIDSEASLSGALDRLKTAATAAPEPSGENSNVPGEAAPDLPNPDDLAAPEKNKPAERKVLYWYDPMQPERHFDQPGKSPDMDRQRVPRFADRAAGAGQADAMEGRAMVATAPQRGPATGGRP